MYYSEQCAKCTDAENCKWKGKVPGWYIEDMGCPASIEEGLKEQGENVVMVVLPSDFSD